MKFCLGSIDFKQGILNSEDIRFFYYEVAQWSELSSLIEYTNTELLNIANELDIKLTYINLQDFCDTTISENEIKFTLRNKNESYQSALLRHLRNSFAHYRITYKNLDFYIEDKKYIKSNRYTCIGLINPNRLRNLICNFHEYDEKTRQTNRC